MESPFQHMETLRQLSEPQNFAEQALLQRQVLESLTYLHKTLLTDPTQLQPCAGLIAQLADLSHQPHLTFDFLRGYNDSCEVSNGDTGVDDIYPSMNKAFLSKADEVSFLKTRLSEAIADWHTNPQVSDSEMAYPLLVHSMLTNEPTYERKAHRIINKTYKTLTSKANQLHLNVTRSSNADNSITDLYTVTTLKTYVTRYSRKKITSLLNRTDCHPITADDNLRLQTITATCR